MDLTVFLIGTALFTGGFALLLYFLVKKKKLTLPFLAMGVGVILCFSGLMLASPLYEDEESEEAFSSLPQ
ncbi:hypothetical protein ACFPU1_15645 [Thalassorhabdus alkalitolerans]|uniref:PEP-CTERM protein-sorting domain-containing protein n=1 Tax=Thalassorhabdus alkalitolerans TaxID=2282697 RepID=A0ABW0YNV8_9BACI|nr:hypothetical protein [Thalassobacillus sp. C254]